MCRIDKTIVQVLSPILKIVSFSHRNYIRIVKCLKLTKKVYKFPLGALFFLKSLNTYRLQINGKNDIKCVKV